MENNYQSLMDEIFGANYKHRTLRTVFDPYSNEWSETNVDEKKSILQKILASKKYNTERVDTLLQALSPL